MRTAHGYVRLANIVPKGHTTKYHVQQEHITMFWEYLSRQNVNHAPKVASVAMEQRLLDVLTVFVQKAIIVKEGHQNKLPALGEHILKKMVQSLYLNVGNVLLDIFVSVVSFKDTYVKVTLVNDGRLSGFT